MTKGDGTHADEKPQVVFMPQMAMDESQLICLSLGDQREMTERRMDESQLISIFLLRVKKEFFLVQKKWLRGENDASLVFMS